MSAGGRRHDYACFHVHVQLHDDVLSGMRGIIKESGCDSAPARHAVVLEPTPFQAQLGHKVPVFEDMVHNENVHSAPTANVDDACGGTPASASWPIFADVTNRRSAAVGSVQGMNCHVQSR